MAYGLTSNKIMFDNVLGGGGATLKVCLPSLEGDGEILVAIGIIDTLKDTADLSVAVNNYLEKAGSNS